MPYSVDGKSFSYRKPLTFDSDGISLSGDLTDQPVAINIDSGEADFWGNAEVLGTSVRFADDAGTTVYEFEVQAYDTTGDDAWFHVKIPTLASGSDTVIYIYYGDEGVPSSGSTKENVWESAFEAAWHFDEDHDDGAFADSTSNNNDLTNSGSTTTTSAGMNNGRKCLGGNQDMTVSDSATLTFGDASTDDPLTFEAVLFSEDITSFRLISSGASAGSPEYVLIVGGDDKVYFVLYDNTSAVNIYLVTDSAVTAWEDSQFHLVGTYDGGGADTGFKLYKDGALLSAVTPVSNGSYTAMHDLTSTFHIGEYFGGDDSNSLYVTEMTISREERSYDWVRARNASRLGTWLTIGAEETPTTDLNISVADCLQPKPKFGG